MWSKTKHLAVPAKRTQVQCMNMLCPSNKMPASGYMKISCYCIVKETHSPLPFTHYHNRLQGEYMSIYESTCAGIKEIKPLPRIKHAILLHIYVLYFNGPILPHINRSIFTLCPCSSCSVFDVIEIYNRTFVSFMYPCIFNILHFKHLSSLDYSRSLCFFFNHAVLPFI